VMPVAGEWRRDFDGGRCHPVPTRNT